MQKDNYINDAKVIATCFILHVLDEGNVSHFFHLIS